MNYQSSKLNAIQMQLVPASLAKFAKNSPHHFLRAIDLTVISSGKDA
jgi:hypothetical protein